MRSKLESLHRGRAANVAVDINSDLEAVPDVLRRDAYVPMLHYAIICHPIYGWAHEPSDA
jgi:hypothetical protein